MSLSRYARPLFILLAACRLTAEPVAAVHKQGAMHGFLTLHAGNKLIGTGEQLTTISGTEVRSRLTFHFNDGSVDDEFAVLRQGPTLELVSDHHIQKGPAFPDPLDMTLQAATGEVTTRVMKDGKLESKTEHMDLPPDLINGMVSNFIQNYPPQTPEIKASYLAGTPKPRVVHLVIKPEEKQAFRIGNLRRSATVYQIHIDLGGAAGLIAPAIGKQPSDVLISIMDGETPTFAKFQGAFFLGGPIWTAAIAVPTLPADH